MYNTPFPARSGYKLITIVAYGLLILYVITIIAWLCDVADELIRQVAINCGERGMLLAKVRDELLMTLAAYRTLYESGVAFKLRNALNLHQQNTDLHKQVSHWRQNRS